MTLNTFVIHRHSAERSTSFRDFTVRRDKVRKALCWLKENNQYYIDIIIDDNVLCTLPDDGSIDDLLPQVRDAENRLQHVDDELHDADRLDGETDDTIVRNFVPSPFPLRSENHVIDDALERMKSETGPIIWPNIGNTAINIWVYCSRLPNSTVYPTGSADL